MAATKKTPEPQPYARITKRVKRPEKDLGPRVAAGTYRVIHGVVTIPRPKELWMRPDGTEIPHEPKSEEATVVIYRDKDGNFIKAEADEIELGSDDATRLMNAGLIERLDASPSRAGRAFDPDVPHMTPRVVRPSRAA